eukprot:CAMPEP_0167781214 /NCGR_PEP_ID=MMETSP0111_2-20121227/5807_1 /TAXON_ID=91324 /ORGANISM="Lotharella globosa, Strain CCCM811" /LENGTH=136 /DNA_ID=CAMNT_0007671849 /DNA_START=48 /DNA_END=458 /DNA_ORIENTATION=-
MTGFFLLTFWDVRRDRKITFRAFCWEVLAAIRLVLPVAPCLVVGFSFLFFVLTVIPRRIGLASVYLVDTLIYYGEFYGPFSVVYFVLKRQFIRKPILPTTAGSGTGKESKRGGGEGDRGVLRQKRLQALRRSTRLG